MWVRWVAGVISVLMIVGGILEIVFRARVWNWQMAHLAEQSFFARTPTRVVLNAVSSIVAGVIFLTIVLFSR